MLYPRSLRAFVYEYECADTQIHELIDGRSNPHIYTSNFAFRLLYNGKILTPQIDGCHEQYELCDIINLKSKLDPIAKRDQDCLVSSSQGTKQDAYFADEEPYLSLSTIRGVVFFVTLVLFCGFVGSSITFIIMQRSYSSNLNRRKGDYGGACNINSSDGDFGLEMMEGFERHASPSLT